MRANGRFTTPAEAEDIVVQSVKDGTLIRLKDVGRAEVGAENYSATTLFDGSPAVLLLAYQLPGTNVWNTANAIKAKILIGKISRKNQMLIANS